MPLIEPRFLSCFNSNLSLDVLEVSSNSGCGYSWIGYAFFRPFFFLPLSYYRFVMIIFYSGLLILNFFVIRKIASLFKVNYIYLILLSLFLIDPLIHEVSTIFVSFTLINLGFLFFLLKSRYYLFFSGLLMVLASFRVQPIVLFFTMLLYLVVSKQKHWYYFLIGGLIILGPMIIFDNLYLQNILFNSQFNSGVNWANLLNFKYLFYLFSFFYLLKSRNWAYSLAFPIIFWSALTNAPRYLAMFSLIHCVFFIHEFKHKKLLLALILFIGFYSFSGVFINYTTFPVRSVFSGQFGLLDESSVIMADLFNNDELLLRHEVLLLADPTPFGFLLDNGLVSYDVLTSELEGLISSNNVNVIVWGPNYESSILNINLSFYDGASSVMMPSIDHDCVNCRHFSTLFFSNGLKAYNFFNHLVDYWTSHQGLICDFSPYYYGFAQHFFSTPDCVNDFDLVLFSDGLRDFNNNLMLFVMFLLLVPLFLKKFNR